MKSNITDVSYIFLRKLAWRFFYYKCGRALLQFRAVLLYYKAEQKLVQKGVGNLLNVKGIVVTKWGRYHKVGQLLQSRAVHLSAFYAIPRNITLAHGELF